MISNVRISRGEWSFQADGVFGKGLHLVCGDVGSGKSTLALLIAGLIFPTTGTVERRNVRSRMISFQFPEYHITGPDLTAECLSWDLDPVTTLAAAGLAGRDSENPLNLSRGEMKRLVLTCVLSREYDMLVLDEPFSSLDCTEKERLCTLLSERKNGMTIVFTHEQSWFPRVDRIWEIEQGILRDRGTLPGALSCWNHAPSIVKDLVKRGRTPPNISRADLLEAACRM